MRKQIEEERKTTVLSLGAPNGLSQKEPEAAQGKKSLKAIAQQCKMDEETVEFLHRAALKSTRRSIRTII